MCAVGSGAPRYARANVQSGWVRVRPARQFSNAAFGRLGSEVFADCEAQYAHDSGPITTRVHETAHSVHGRIRSSLPAGWNAFFVGGGEAFVCREPRMRLSDVLPRVPVELRGPNAALYLRRQCAYWDDAPLYVLDELSAYLLACRAGLETGRADQSDFRRVAEFSGYAAALLSAIDELDPRYRDAELLASFVSAQLDVFEGLQVRARQAGAWDAGVDAAWQRFRERFVIDACAR